MCSLRSRGIFQALCLGTVSREKKFQMKISTVNLSSVVLERLGHCTLLIRHASLPIEENPVSIKKKKMNEHMHRHKHTHTHT